MQIQKSAFARLLTLVLAAALLVGVLCTGASAATAANVKQYDTYVCLGNSIAAGYGPYNTEIKGFARVDVAYHAQVADAVGAKTFYPLARTGFRTTELRYMLDAGYEGDDYLFKIYNLEESQRIAMRPVFTQAIKDADLITLNVGSNDVMNYAFIRAYSKLYATDSSQLATRIQEFLDKSGSIGAAISELFSTAQMLGKLPAVASEFISGLYEGYQNFKTNWDPILRCIYSLNPDVTVVAVGLFNPIKNTKLTESSLIPIGRSFDAVVQLMNRYIQSGSRYASRYRYADVTDTEVFDLPPLTSDEFMQVMIQRVHPTLDGHRFMAEQILAVLPERGEDPTPAPVPDPAPEPSPVKTFPFKDVTPLDWFYDNVYYVWENNIMEGMSADTFQPNSETTRAQFATVLYRMEGRPDVTDEQRAACTFTDLKADWYRDAVVWAYAEGVVKGLSTSQFDPDAKITREQMVTMLYRYSGETVKNTDLSVFTDSDSVSAYARPAVAWAVHEGIVNGMTPTTFVPQGNATRAQLAAILNRYMER